MKNAETLQVTASKGEIVLILVFDAPRRVFEAWTKPELLKRWFEVEVGHWSVRSI
jgi:uncharacterized protein YndB with AHSA1/START domain